MISPKSIRKFTAIVANLSLLLNSFIPYLMVAQPIFAQDITPTVIVENTPVPTPETTVAPENTPTSEPTVEPTVTVEPTAAVDPTATPTIESIPTIIPSAVPTNSEVGTNTPSPESTPLVTVVSTAAPTTVPEKVCLTDQQIKDSLTKDWNTDTTTKISETKNKVELGVKYIFPQENKVSVMFKCLPKDESLRTTLKIQQVKTSDLKLPSNIGDVGEYAYDITTNMTDGTFEYDVTLPKTQDSTAKVSYMENVGSEIKTIDESQLNQETDVVKAISIDHFTIFLITANATVTSSSVSNPNNGWVSDNNYAVFNDNSYSTEYGFPVISNPSAITAGSIINGIEVLVEGNTNDKRDFKVSIWNASSNTYTSSEKANMSHSDSTKTLGGSTNLWGKSWTVNDFSDANFKIKVEVTSNDGTAYLDHVEVKIYATEPVVTVTNPTLPSTCGLDIALVLDNSTSISSSEMTQMKNAMTAFTNALLGTPTYFSVTHFATTATVDRAFTSNITNVNNSINGIPVGGGFTNWQDGLTKAQGTFDPRTDKPNLVIFASDGNPNTIGNGSDPGGASESTAVSAAQTVANTLKSGGTRILTIGIGSDLDSNNLKAISGNNLNTGDILTSDVITTDFAGLATQLATFAKRTCGGKISINKYVDNVQQSDGQTWSFKVDGTTTLTTDSNGQVASGTLSVGNHSVSEISIPNGYSYDHATCTNGTNDPTNSGVKDIAVTADSIISCNFYNITSKGSIKIIKNANPDSSQQFSFTTTGAGLSNFNLTDNGGVNSKTFSNLAAGSYTVSETAIDGWYSDGGVCDKDETPDSLDVGPGETVTCTFTNTKKNDIAACKFNDVNGNGIQDTGDTLLNGWEMTLTPGNIKQSTVNGCTTFSGLLPGKYTVTETQQTDWINTTGLSKEVNLTSSQNETVSFGNFACANISGTKWEDLNGNGVKDSNEPIVSGVTMNLTGVDTQTTTTNTNGNYSFKVCKGGDVSIKEVNPDSEVWYRTYPTSDSHNITVQSGGNYTNNNFGNAKYASISGIKYRDNDGNGVLNADDLASTLSGWVIDLYDATTNSVISSYTTLSDGIYKFNKLFVDKSYYVLENLTAGWTQTVGPEVKDVIEVKSGDNKTVNFANFENMSVTACKLEDLDGSLDTKFDQTPVAGWTVKLGNDSQKTGENGCYTWTNLTPGSYSVSEVSEDGWTNLTSTTHNFGAIKNGETYSHSFINFKNAKIIVHKNVLGTDGITDVADNTSFTTQLNSANSKTISENTDATYDNLTPGTYTVSETTPPSTHSFVSISDNGVVTVKSGQTYDVTITNKQKSAQLTVIKKVDNSNGGDKDSSDFTMNLTGTNLSDDSFPGNSSGTTVTLDAGDYTVDESSTSGYTKTLGNNCSGTINFGESKTCTITNDDQQSYIVVNKTVVNDDGSKALPNDFSLTVDDNSVLDEVAYPVNPGKHTVGETNLPGYTAGTWGGDCDSEGDVEVALGETKTCTITNNDQPGTLIVKKVIINDNGGNAVPEDFSFSYSEGTSTKFESDGQNEIALNSGTYDVTETPTTGYKVSYEGCSDMVLINGGTTTCTITNDDVAPKLTVTKTVNNDNEGTKEVSDFNLYIDDLQVTSGVVATVSANTVHTLSEDNLPGYSASSWGGDCSTDGKITLLPGDDKTCTITNDDTYGKVIVTKFNDLNGNGFKDDNEPTLPDWKIKLTGNGTQDTDKSGITTFNQVIPGEYSLSEIQQKGWQQTGIYCSSEEPTSTPTPTEEPTATPTDTQEDTGLCHWNEGKDEWNALNVSVDNPGHAGHTKDYPYAGPYDIHGQDKKDADEWCHDNDPSRLSSLFVKPAFAISEDNNDSYLVNVRPEQTVECFIGNQYLTPKLTISKFNNTWPNNTSVGSEVEYSLRLEVDDNNISGVSVIDLPPDGFKYKSGSYKVFVNGLPLSIPEPVYHSPGQWLIGDLNKDDVVTLSYIATIDSSVDPGLYKDAAYAYGLDGSDKILASAVSSGKSDSGVLTTNFVGSKVGLEPEVSSQEINIVKEETSGQVLGATTEMPSTGASTIWLFIIGLLSTVGFGLIGYGLKSKKHNLMKNLFIFTLVGLAIVSQATSVNAVQSSNIFIRIENPTSPTNKDKFNLSFTSLDIMGRALTVKCFKVNPDTSEVQLGADVFVKAGGNSGLCNLDNSPLTDNGKTYYFYAVASSGSESYTSETVSVDFNTNGPGTPNDYRKDKEGTCNYKISFRASNDSKTTKIRIYRADVTKFIADAGTQIGEVGISPDQNGSFTDVNVPDCNKTYYYVIRAFDNAGNGSGLAGDSITVVTSSTTTNTTTTNNNTSGAIPAVGQNNNIPGENTASGEPTGEPAQGEGSEPGTVLGSEDNTQSFISRNKVPLALTAAFLLIIIGYGIKQFQKKRR